MSAAVGKPLLASNAIIMSVSWICCLRNAYDYDYDYDYATPTTTPTAAASHEHANQIDDSCAVLHTSKDINPLLKPSRWERTIHRQQIAFSSCSWPVINSTMTNWGFRKNYYWGNIFNEVCERFRWGSLHTIFHATIKWGDKHQSKKNDGEVVECNEHVRDK